MPSNYKLVCIVIAMLIGFVTTDSVPLTLECSRDTPANIILLDASRSLGRYHKQVLSVTELIADDVLLASGPEINIISFSENYESLTEGFTSSSLDITKALEAYAIKEEKKDIKKALALTYQAAPLNANVFVITDAVGINPKTLNKILRKFQQTEVNIFFVAVGRFNKEVMAQLGSNTRAGRYYNITDIEEYDEKSVDAKCGRRCNFRVTASIETPLKFNQNLKISVQVYNVGSKAVPAVITYKLGYDHYENLGILEPNAIAEFEISLGKDSILDRASFLRSIPDYIVFKFEDQCANVDLIPLHAEVAWSFLPTDPYLGCNAWGPLQIALVGAMGDGKTWLSNEMARSVEIKPTGKVHGGSDHGTVALHLENLQRKDKGININAQLYDTWGFSKSKKTNSIDIWPDEKFVRFLKGKMQPGESMYHSASIWDIEGSNHPTDVLIFVVSAGSSYTETLKPKIDLAKKNGVPSMVAITQWEANPDPEELIVSWESKLNVDKGDIFLSKFRKVSRDTSLQLISSLKSAFTILMRALELGEKHRQDRVNNNCGNRKIDCKEECDGGEGCTKQCKCSRYKGWIPYERPRKSCMRYSKPEL